MHNMYSVDNRKNTLGSNVSPSRPLCGDGPWQMGVYACTVLLWTPRHRPFSPFYLREVGTRAEKTVTMFVTLKGLYFDVMTLRCSTVPFFVKIPLHPSFGLWRASVWWTSNDSPRQFVPQYPSVCVFRSFISSFVHSALPLFANSSEVQHQYRRGLAYATVYFLVPDRTKAYREGP